MQAIINDLILELIKCDITDLAVDASVSDANSCLVLGFGVAGAIDEKGGPSIQAECDAIGYCDVGSAMITSGGNLPARYVNRAVGPVQGEGDEEAKLTGATLASLELAKQYDLESIAFPAISTGVFGYPLSTTTKESRGKMVAGEDDETNTTVTTKCGTDCSPGSAIPNEQRWAVTATGTNNSAGGRARHGGGQNRDNCAAERRK